MSPQSKGLVSLSVLVCLFLIGCSNSGENSQAIEPVFEGTGRTLEQIMSDIDFKNFNDSLSAYESAAYNMCDCLSGVDFEGVIPVLDKWKSLEEEFEDPDERVKQLPAEEWRILDVFSSCGALPMGEFIERRIYNYSRDSILIYSHKTCPYLMARFMEISEAYQ